MISTHLYSHFCASQIFFCFSDNSITSPYAVTYKYSRVRINEHIAFMVLPDKQLYFYVYTMIRHCILPFFVAKIYVPHNALSGVMVENGTHNDTI